MVIELLFGRHLLKEEINHQLDVTMISNLIVENGFPMKPSGDWKKMSMVLMRR